MKIAICMSGVPRYYDRGFSMMKDFYEGCDIDYYIHSWADESSVCSTRETMSALYSPKKIMVEPFCDFQNYFDCHTITNLSPSISNAVSWLKSVHSVGLLLEEETTDYDWVIFTRTDVVALGKKFKDIISGSSNKTIHSSYVNGGDWVIDKNNMTTAGLIDTKFICSTKNHMVHFSRLYESLTKYVVQQNVPLCHHRLIYHHMSNHVKQNGHKQLWISDKSLNGGWFFIRDKYLQGY
jgi:hypothetical protein